MTMTTVDETRHNFSNRRQWRDFIASVHASMTLPCAVTYPMVQVALHSGRAWFNLSKARASSWLGGAPVALAISLARLET
jgi:hypothetical protein